MALLSSTVSALGSSAHPFSLLGVDGQTYHLSSFKNSKGLLVIFMCNHCPYVIAIEDRLNQLAREMIARGIAVIGINSNDPLYNDDDSFEKMKQKSREKNYCFPYCMDETQSIARVYDAVCTPDPYLYINHSPLSSQSPHSPDPDFRLVYRGRIDDSWKDESTVKEHSLRDAMERVLSGHPAIKNQVPSMGCSIKWKELTRKK